MSLEHAGLDEHTDPPPTGAASTSAARTDTGSASPTPTDSSESESLRSVRRPALSAEVIARLRERITSGDWPVGSRIPPEPELMSRLQVARGTLREAIRALAHAGLLDVRQGDGTYVRATSELSGAVERLYGGAGIGHVLEVREALDVQAARLAAVRAEPADLAVLDEALRRRRVAWDARDFDAWIEADWDFHRGVADATHNPLLAELYRNLAGPLRASVANSWTDPDYQGAHPAGHEDLVRALRDSDPAAAARQAGENLTDTQEWHAARSKT
ncbi:FadR/GntR family transcriptional regulator [Streptomyces sp. SID3343]|uniref:FadR/GntR family transcriptional regulator n=1 Tax=Streptomyces sp. SID3343 TaxID=2690260 RepID=UPI00136B09FD|nr:FadR/GntR family transcriptional regulator [Streptomyces sp. SID3343]MYV97852.1 FCD domain-containing protein [Streptomyces sp. SID3343]